MQNTYQIIYTLYTHFECGLEGIVGCYQSGRDDMVLRGSSGLVLRVSRHGLDDIIGWGVEGIY